MLRLTRLTRPSPENLSRDRTCHCDHGSALAPQILSNLFVTDHISRLVPRQNPESSSDANKIESMFDVRTHDRRHGQIFSAFCIQYLLCARNCLKCDSIARLLLSEKEERTEISSKQVLYTLQVFFFDCPYPAPLPSSSRNPQSTVCTLQKRNHNKIYSKHAPRKHKNEQTKRSKTKTDRGPDKPLYSSMLFEFVASLSRTQHRSLRRLTILIAAIELNPRPTLMRQNR